MTSWNEFEEGVSLNTGDNKDNCDNMVKLKIVKTYNDSTEEYNDVDIDTNLDNNDDDEDVEKLNKFEALLKELDSDKYAYDKYLRLCDLSHATGDLDSIRKAYTKFSQIYPLTPELWQRYINVELSISQSPKELEMVETLFRKALDDYYSCDLAKQFLSIAPRLKDSLAIWNEIIPAYGLHCMKGTEFFKLYREYLNYEEKLGKDIKTLYIESFVTQLQYPLNGMEETFIEFKVFYEKSKDELASDIKWDTIEKKYYAAKTQLLEMLPYEDKIISINEKAFEEKASIYFDYIKTVHGMDVNFNIIQVLYERMVADCCLNAECWLQYINFMDEHKKRSDIVSIQKRPSIFKQNALDISEKALRNCSWCSELYIKHMHLLELMGKPKELIQECLENALSAGFRNPEPVVQIWLAYLTYLRRRINWQNDDECEVLRKNFNLSWTVLGQQWGVLADCNCEILQFWGRLEYGPLRDSKRGKELWTTVMESSNNATKSGLWIEFIQMEMGHDLDSTRKLFSKALHVKHLDNPLIICSAWERFERCNGTVKTLEKCLNECTKIQNQMNTLIGNTQENYHKKINYKKLEKGKKNYESTLKRKSSPTQSPINFSKKLRKTSETSNVQIVDTVLATNSVTERETDQLNSNSKQYSYKGHENQIIDEASDRLRIFLSNLDYNITEGEIRQGLSNLQIINLELIRSANGKSRGFGYAQLENETEVEKALSMDRVILCGRPLFISSVLRDKQKRQKFKYSVEVEPKKLFVKFLPNDITQKELEDIFSVFGKLKDIRLVYHKSGKFKNIAYIEYEKETDAERALTANQMDIRGHIISVVISAPPPKAEMPKASNSTKLLINSLKLHKKPRMSLIPTVVQKNFTTNIKTDELNLNKKTQDYYSQSSKERGPQLKNEDFRKLMQPS